MKKIFSLVFLLFLLVSLTFNIKAEDVNYKEDKIIVVLNNGYKFDEKIKDKIESNFTTIKKYSGIKVSKDTYYSILFKNNVSNIKDKVERLSKEKEFKDVQLSYIYKQIPIASSITKKKAASNSWHIDAINASFLKNDLYIPTTSNKIKVGVLDTGLDKENESLKNHVNNSLSYNFVDNNSNYDDLEGHGTHVSGLIMSDNEKSVGKNIELVSLKVLGLDGGDSEDIVRAINYAQKNGIKILNMSLGYESKYGYDFMLYDSMAAYNGLFVIASGNDASKSVNYPAAYELDNIISVGASSQTNQITNFTNYNNKDLDILAPGFDVYSSCSIDLIDCFSGNPSQYDPVDNTAKMSGTSMATPIVTGVIGTLMSYDNTLSPIQLKQTILNNTSKYDYLSNKVLSSGIIDAKKAYDSIKKGSNYSNTFGEIQTNGSINLWGDNANGQIGNGNKVDVDQTTPFNYIIPNEKIIKAYYTNLNVYLITDLGNLYISGDNSINQMGNSSITNNTTFVKFNKYNSSHFVESIELYNSKQMYDPKSIKINIKSSSSSEKNYYYVGNGSEQLQKEAKVFANRYRFTIIKNNEKDTIYYLSGDNRSYTNKEKFNYTSFNFYGVTYRFLVNIVQEDIYSTYRKVHYREMEYGNKENIYKLSTYTYNKSNVKTNLDVTYYNDYSYMDASTGMLVNNIKKDNSSHYYYSSGKLTKKIYYNYNSYGYLKTIGSNIAYREDTTYNTNGKVLKVYHADYNSTGARKKVLLYRYNKYYSKYDYFYTYKYDSSYKYSSVSYLKKTKGSSLVTSYLKTYKYGKSYKSIYKNYSKNKINNIREYYYNKYGNLKTSGNSKAYRVIKYYNNGKLSKTYKWTYDKKGKLTNLRIYY